MSARTRTTGNVTVTIVSISLLAAMGGAQSSYAYSAGERAKSWDFYVPLTYAFDTTIDGKQGSSVDVNDDVGFGFGGGYNFNNHLNLGGVFNWNSRGYDATGIRDDGSGTKYSSDLEMTTLALNATYYVLSSPITPFVSGSVGYSFIDTNIQSGPSDVACYWDPWWGYICDEYVPTRNEEGVSYGVGIGIRADVGETGSFQLSYNKAWMEIDNAAGTPDFDSIRLDFIFRMH